MFYQLGLIGYPIKHSLSPWIHETFLQRTKLNGNYSLIEIKPKDSFANAMDTLKKQNLHGFNVTVPYKEKIIPYLQGIDEQAKHIGAVNTVLCKNGEWFGYNTDGIGYVRSLQNHFPELKTEKEKQILILGAGGAAKGIYSALLKNGFQNISIANRTIEKAKTLLTKQSNEANIKVITLKEAEENIALFDVIIQTTSVGMKPNEAETILSLHALKESVIVSDIVYQPLYTSFLQTAQSLGARIHFGHTMLLYQAQYAFEIWTNHVPNVQHMDKELQKILEG